MERERRELRLRGIVQGVGLRPWAVRRARARGLAGSVENDGCGVRVALEGPTAAVEAWLAELRETPPAGTRLEAVECARAPLRGERDFSIRESGPRAAGPATRIPPDVAVCGACLTELFDPGSRRYRHPFAHCADCGPRASVLVELPFDRARTSLKRFAPCAQCAGEYADPGDRRFHAQTICCPDCGPRLAAVDARGTPLAGDPVERAAEALRRGAVVALKGYGGYHLAVDACSSEAVARLRKRKHRPHKPFALLVPDLPTASRLAALAPADAALLAGPARPVVIAPRRATDGDATGLAPEVAPGTDDLGLLLPHAPLHHLLLHAPGARPDRDAPRFRALVLTSANRSGEPTEHEDEGTRERLAGIADLFVVHDRGVARPCDDSVFRTAPGGPIPIRRSRATAPLALPWPVAAGAPPILAVGGDLKCAPALLVDGEIHLEAHVGDLESLRSLAALELRVHALRDQAAFAPVRIAHDLHPDQLGTAFARESGLPTLAVQHHHAHAVSCLVEHGHPGPALALCLDGMGFGPDGSLWGGELLRVELARFERLAHLEPVFLPGGDRAAREPWRAAARWLARAFPEGDAPPLPWHARREASSLALLERMAERGVNGAWTSSCGRLFDAVASLLDRGDVASHEGAPAMALESLAARAPADASRPPADDACATSEAPAGADPSTIPAADLVRALAVGHARGEDPARLARRFHLALARRLADVALDAERRHGPLPILLTGGCFQNRLLLEAVRARITAAGRCAWTHRRVPPNDGGLAVGQAAVAAARLASAA